MANVSYPGVYVEEIPGGARPIESASTSTAAFVGEAQMGPGNEALRITSWDQFQKYYGTFIDGSYLAQSVYQYFNNGGRQCYIARVLRSGAEVADVTVRNRASSQVDQAVTFSARNEGEWGNYLYLEIENGTNDPGNTFKVSVRRQEQATIIPTGSEEPDPVEVFNNLSMDPDSADYCETIIGRDSDLINVKVLAVNDSLQQGLYKGSYFELADADVETIIGRKFEINVDADGYREVTLPDSVFNSGSTVGGLHTAIKLAVRNLAPPLRGRTPAEAYSEFSCDVEPDTNKIRFVLTSGSNFNTQQNPNGLTPEQQKRSSVRVRSASTLDLAAALKLKEADGASYEDALAVRRPLEISPLQIGDNVVAGDVTGARSGSDGNGALQQSDFESTFGLLDDKTDFSLLAVPGIGTTWIFDAGVSFCERRPLRDVFFIGETGPYDDDPSLAEIFRKNLTKANSYGALYYPWLLANDPSGKSAEPIRLPPSGYITGLYGRIDNTRGVWKAPAGTEASLSGAVGLIYALTDIEQGNLNPINVNGIRRFDLAGIVSWGARTITSDPEWKYVPVRRTAIMLRKSIYDGIQWAVFESNDEPLWSALRLNIGSFMNGLFRAGAFQGSKASDAYFVRCGLGDTMTQGDIDRGQVIALVGFAPLKPAEFVIVRIQQKVGQQ